MAADSVTVTTAWVRVPVGVRVQENLSADLCVVQLFATSAGEASKRRTLVEVPTKALCSVSPWLAQLLEITQDGHGAIVKVTLLDVRPLPIFPADLSASKKIKIKHTKQMPPTTERFDWINSCQQQRISTIRSDLPRTLKRRTGQPRHHGASSVGIGIASGGLNNIIASGNASVSSSSASAASSNAMAGVISPLSSSGLGPVKLANPAHNKVKALMRHALSYNEHYYNMLPLYDADVLLKVPPHLLKRMDQLRASGDKRVHVWMAMYVFFEDSALPHHPSLCSRHADNVQWHPELSCAILYRAVYEMAMTTGFTCNRVADMPSYDEVIQPLVDWKLMGAEATVVETNAAEASATGQTAEQAADGARPVTFWLQEAAAQEKLLLDEMTARFDGDSAAMSSGSNVSQPVELIDCHDWHAGFYKTCLQSGEVCLAPDLQTQRDAVAADIPAEQVTLWNSAVTGELGVKSLVLMRAERLTLGELYALLKRTRTTARLTLVGCRRTQLAGYRHGFAMLCAAYGCKQLSWPNAKDFWQLRTQQEILNGTLFASRLDTWQQLTGKIKQNDVKQTLVLCMNEEQRAQIMRVLSTATQRVADDEPRGGTLMLDTTTGHTRTVKSYNQQRGVLFTDGTRSKLADVRRADIETIYRYRGVRKQRVVVVVDETCTPSLLDSTLKYAEKSIQVVVAPTADPGLTSFSGLPQQLDYSRSFRPT